MSENPLAGMSMEEIANAIEFTSDAIELIYALRDKHELPVIIADQYDVYEIIVAQAEIMHLNLEDPEDPYILRSIEYDVNNHQIFKTTPYSPADAPHKKVLTQIVQEVIKEYADS